MKKPLRVLSLGAGVQSTTVLLMMLHGQIERADAVAFDKALREKKRIRERFGWAGLHSSMKPLDEVDLRTDEEKGVFNLFDGAFSQECEGMCGI